MRQEPKEQKMQIIVLRVVSRFLPLPPLSSFPLNCQPGQLLKTDSDYFQKQLFCGFSQSVSEFMSVSFPCPQQPVIIVLWAVELLLPLFLPIFIAIFPSTL